MVTHHACIIRCRTIPCPSDPAPCAADVLMRRRKGSPRRTQWATVGSGIGSPSSHVPGCWRLPTPAATPTFCLPSSSPA